MPCFKPLKGYRAINPSASGKYQVLFSIKGVYLDKPMDVPCGQCVGCRLERSRQWAIRCVHETQDHEFNSFITLTYNNDHLPVDGSLQLDHWQRFMKRLRERLGGGVRFYHCGEYGSQFGRPHYHALIFGYDFPDKKFWKMAAGNSPLYTSAFLEELWPYGYSSIGEANFLTAAYVARYIMKKRLGLDAKSHYERFNPETGEVFYVKPEYTTMSRRPGIGRNWFEKFRSDVFPRDEVVIRGKKMKPPRYYDNLFEVEFPGDFQLIKSQRRKDAKKHLDNNTPSRLRVREQVQLARLAKLPRQIE